MIYNLIKNVLFILPAERAHHITTGIFNFICAIPGLKQLTQALFKLDHPSLRIHLWGLDFKNPVGLAAGFDKDGKYISSMSTLGFGFIEVGTVTPRPQIGNPKPRLFRLIKDKAIINRMGFNNEGVDVLVNRLKRIKKSDVIIGGNIGKNKDTANEDAYKDYLICFEKLYDYVDYFVVNLSSPNTPGLRSLQEKGPLKKILSTLLTYKDTQTIKRPILLKIAPDLTDGQLKDVVEIVDELSIEGIIATNTTIERRPLPHSTQSMIEDIGAGGLSGAPLAAKSTEIVKKIYQQSNGKIPIIGVGGIHSYETAKDKLNAGASLIQVYSGFIYEGPYLIKNIKKMLIKR